MRRTTLAYNSVLLLLSCILMACTTGRAHENFRNAMARNVGLHENEPTASINYYRERVAARRSLANGNTEVKYRAGHWTEADECYAYFEIDRLSRKIISWRYEGTPNSCAIVP